MYIEARTYFGTIKAEVFDTIEHAIRENERGYTQKPGEFENVDTKVEALGGWVDRYNNGWNIFRVVTTGHNVEDDEDERDEIYVAIQAEDQDEL